MAFADRYVKWGELAKYGVYVVQPRKGPLYNPKRKVEAFLWQTQAFLPGMSWPSQMVDPLARSASGFVPMGMLLICDLQMTVGKWLKCEQSAADSCVCVCAHTCSGPMCTMSFLSLFCGENSLLKILPHSCFDSFPALASSL